MSGTEWATLDTILPEKNTHIRGTIERGGKLEFWLSRPRPEGYTLDEWEALEQAKWERIFGKKREK